MKKKIMSFLLAFICFISCGLCLTSCKNKDVWTFPKRISLNLSNKLHVEYINTPIIGDSSLPSYCVLVKEGNYYYVKTPTTYQSDRLEVYEKTNLNNAVEFAGSDYGQGYISARWSDYTNTWISASDDLETTPNAPEWHANDKNNHVYSVGIAFLDSGYGDINHIYENGVADNDGHKYTATQISYETLTIDSKQIECEVWEYEEYHSADVWRKAKYWFEAETHIVLKQTTVMPSSENQSLDADENIGLQASYFSKTDTMESYLTSINRWPVSDFSSYK